VEGDGYGEKVNQTIHGMRRTVRVEAAARGTELGNLSGPRTLSLGWSERGQGKSFKNNTASGEKSGLSSGGKNQGGKGNNGILACRAHPNRLNRVRMIGGPKGSFTYLTSGKEENVDGGFQEKKVKTKCKTELLKPKKRDGWGLVGGGEFLHISQGPFPKNEREPGELDSCVGTKRKS